jgi:hypothetical protein
MAARTLKVPRILVVIGMVIVAAGTICELCALPWISGPYGGLQGFARVVSVPFGMLLVSVAWWLFSAVVRSGPKAVRAFRSSSVVLTVALLAVSSFYLADAYGFHQQEVWQMSVHGPAVPRYHSILASYGVLAIGLIVMAIGFAVSSRIPSATASDSTSDTLTSAGNLT